MRKVSFPFTVRHGGVRYTPGTPVEVKEEEVKEMLAMGATLLEEKAEEHAAEESATEEAMAEATETIAEAADGAEPAPAEDGKAETKAEEKTAEEKPAELDGQENLFEQAVEEKPKRGKKK